MSCSGCRVLRKGCSESCILRPCLQWIGSPEAQSHATVFVAKFFGRAGLMSFISNVPSSHRAALFRSLLYDACGRTVNPVSGAVGLLWTGNWQACQAAVETVLRGGTLCPIPALSSVISTPSESIPYHADEDTSEVVCASNMDYNSNNGRMILDLDSGSDSPVNASMFPKPKVIFGGEEDRDMRCKCVDLCLAPPQMEKQRAESGGEIMMMMRGIAKKRLPATWSQSRNSEEESGMTTREGFDFESGLSIDDLPKQKTLLLFQ